MKWEENFIKDICQINPENISRNYPFDYIKYLDITSVGSGIINEFKDIQIMNAPSRAKRIVRKDDSIIATVRPGNKSYYFFKNASNNFIVSTGFAVLRPKIEKVEPRFLYYTISQPNFIAYLVSHEQGANYPAVTPDVIGNKIIELPPLPIQRKIASILSAYDDLIENNLIRIKFLEEKARSHYKELMKEFNSSKSQRKVLIKDCISYYIGGGWGEEEYKEEFTEPAYVIRGTDIPDVKIGNIAGVPYRYHRESNLASRRLKNGDIIFEVSGGSKSQFVGRSLLITESLLNQFSYPIMFASFCKLLRANEIITPEFLYLYLLESYENGVIRQYEKHSASNIVNYGFEELITRQKITLPKEIDLYTFSNNVKSIFLLIGILGNQNTKLREARDILLPKLINGDINFFNNLNHKQND